MSAGGAGLGFHSHAHRNMGKMTAAEAAGDTATGVASFARHLGARPRFFAFPFGHFGSYTPEATAVLSHHGIELFFTTELGRTPLTQAEKLFSRIVIHPEDDLDSFRRKLYGGYDWVGRVRRLGYALRPAFRPVKGGQRRLTCA
jgi:peptidoglycan/xylan/chitin deacetylase (PgdA/CDA1 family)